MQEDNSLRWVEGRSEKTAAQTESLVGGHGTSLGRAGLLRQLWGTYSSGGLWVTVHFWKKQWERERNEALAVEPHVALTYISCHLVTSEGVSLTLLGPTIIHLRGDFHALSSVEGYR